MTFFSDPQVSAWSPCSKFIAIFYRVVQILDAVTLRRLAILNMPEASRIVRGGAVHLLFSPNSRFLTQFGDMSSFNTWDTQTGVLVSSISQKQQRGTKPPRLPRGIPNPQKSGPKYPISATYSACETMLGVLFCHASTFTVSTYNVLSGIQIYSHLANGQVVGQIWTYGEFLQFATMGLESIIIWKIGFTSANMLTQIGSLPVPDSFNSLQESLFHPTLHLLAYITGKKVLIWDAENSKLLLDSIDIKGELDIDMSFSSDGHFFACAGGPETYLWKESPNGYILYRKLTSDAGAYEPHISPNGELIVTLGNSSIQLWHTMDSTVFSTTSTQVPPGRKNNFILQFSPDEALALVTRIGDETVTVLDLKSGIPQLVINAGMGICGLRVAGGTAILVGDGKITTWNLSAGDCVQTIAFDHPSFPTYGLGPAISISPNLCYIAITDWSDHLHLYNTHNGQHLRSVATAIDQGVIPWFTPSGHEVWGVDQSGNIDRWGIVENNESDIPDLVHTGLTRDPPDGFPWKSSNDYKDRDDHWIFHSSGKRLFWLPPHWQTDWTCKMWVGRFLALLHKELPEAVILELE